MTHYPYHDYQFRTMRRKLRELGVDKDRLALIIKGAQCMIEDFNPYLALSDAHNVNHKGDERMYFSVNTCATWREEDVIAYTQKRNCKR